MKWHRFAYYGLVGVVLALTGCSNANQALNSTSLPLEARVKNRTRASVGADWSNRSSATSPSIVPPQTDDAPATPVDANDDGYFVGLCLSGGGSRSAVFSAACMFELQRLGVLQHVDYISAVSGGSLTAAYYCLNDDDWNPANVQRKLTHSFATDLIAQVAMPWNLFAMLVSDWDRSDLLANSLRTNLYSRGGHELTFADLRPDRPRLLLNATDLQSGRSFVFCNESFDQINSDLSKYPISYAVAASAAVPVLMHQVTLRDYSTVFKQYRHLIDGGVNDNLGITTLVETYDAQIKAAHRAGRPAPYPHGAIFLVIDARTEFDAQLSDRSDTGLFESLQASAGLTSTALLNRASSATLSDIIVKYSPAEVTAEQLRAQIKRLDDDGTLDLQDQDHRPVRVIHLALSRLSKLPEPPFISFSDKVNSIATYFNIDPTEAYHLHKAADLLIREEFQQPLEEIAHDLAQPHNVSTPVR